MTENIRFADLGISEDILSALEKKGFVSPTPIQARVIPHLLGEVENIIGQAQTGTGKTAAFGIPILEKCQQGKRKIQALVLTPTRELAVQVTEEIVSLKGKRNLFILPVYGGQGMDYQLTRLREGVDIVVGTPGRVIDHLERGKMDLSELKFLVLDEADEMLNMGFLEEVEKVLQYAPANRQMLLFSATMPDNILRLAKKYMGEYEMVKVEKKQMTAMSVNQIYYEVYAADKFAALCRIIDTEKEFYALIFCKTKNGTDELANQLIDKGYDVEALHGDVSQYQRERIMRKFKAQHSTILVATDVAARGIDVNNLTHVINYDIPGDSETYTHRVGRTGRAGKEGTAITLATPADFRRLSFIMKDTKTEIKRGKLPSVNDALDRKKVHISEEVMRTVTHETFDEYLEMAAQVMTFSDADSIVAALLKRSFGNQLNLNSYSEIRDPREEEMRRRKSGERPSNDRGSFKERSGSGDRFGDKRRGDSDRKPFDRDRKTGTGTRERFGDKDKGGFRDRDKSDRFGKDRDRSGSRNDRDKVGFGGRDRDKDKSSGFKGSLETLFYARGAKDGVTPDKLMQFITKESGISSQRIVEIDIFQKHTTFKLPYAEAGKVISTFRTGADTKPLVRRDRKE